MAFALDNILYTVYSLHLFILDQVLGQYTLHCTVYICLYLTKSLDNILYILQSTSVYTWPCPWTIYSTLYSLHLFILDQVLGQYTLHSTVYICLYLTKSLDNILYNLQFSSVYTWPNPWTIYSTLYSLLLFILDQVLGQYTLHSTVYICLYLIKSKVDSCKIDIIARRSEYLIKRKLRYLSKFFYCF